MTIFSRPFILALVAIFILAGLLGGSGNLFDAAFNQWAAGLRGAHPQLTSLAAILTQLGRAYTTLGLALLACIILAVRMQGRQAIALAAIVLIERLSVDGMKLLAGRPRPDLELPALVPGSFSFPSGHSANSMTAFMAIALIAVPQRWRGAALAAAMSISIIVGLTRIVLGVHWPSDVIGGWAWGLLVVGFGMTLARRSGAIEAEHQVVGGHRSPAGRD
jgi:undecaprenyl-diphosphatase